MKQKGHSLIFICCAELAVLAVWKENYPFDLMDFAVKVLKQIEC